MRRRKIEGPTKRKQQATVNPIFSISADAISTEKIPFDTETVIKRKTTSRYLRDVFYLWNCYLLAVSEQSVEKICAPPSKVENQFGMAN